MNLILSTPSIEYAQAVSHELWMLARPRGFSENETSQYYCGTFAHPDGTKVAIGPIDGQQNVHAKADEVAFVDIIRAALTEGEALALTNVINVNKGGTVQLTDIIQATPSLAPNLITREGMQDGGWFPEVDEV